MQTQIAVEQETPDTVLVEGLADAAEGDLAMTLEALLPQFRAMCRAFYRNHPPDAHPVAAHRWIFRELINRFGNQETLDAARQIAARLDIAKRGVIAALAAHCEEES